MSVTDVCPFLQSDKYDGLELCQLINGLSSTQQYGYIGHNWRKARWSSAVHS